jgi:hypothetical protein
MLFAIPAANPVFNISRLFIYYASLTIRFTTKFTKGAICVSCGGLFDSLFLHHPSSGRLPTPNQRLFAVTTTRLSVAIRASAQRANLTNGKPIKKYIAAVKIPTPI